MFGKVLIFVLSLASLAVLVHSGEKECECKPPPCDADTDVPKVKAYLEKVNSKCGKKNDEDYKTCMSSCGITLMGSQILTAVSKRKCTLEDLNKMTDEDDRNCCKTTVEYFKDCQVNAVADGATPLRELS